MSEPRGNLLPVYFVADHSGSMYDQVNDLNQGLIGLLDAMRYESFAASKVRFSVLGFNDHAGVVLPLSDLRFVEVMPTFEAYGGTNYSEVIDLLAAVIPSDVAALKAEGYRVYRPAVFFMTDGQPLDETWPDALARLNSIPARPTILSFGLGDADASVLSTIASPQLAHMYNGSGSPAEALRSVITSLTNSVVQSGNAMANEQTVQALHFDRPDDFVRIDIDEV